MRIYVACPFRGDTKQQEQTNISRALAITQRLREEGFEVFNAHETFLGLDDDIFRDKILKICCEEVEKCDILFLGSGWRCSPGSLLELHCARLKGIPVFDDFQELLGAIGSNVKPMGGVK